MEFFLALLFTTRYVLGNGNLDLLYFASIVILGIVLIRRNANKYIYIVLCFLGYFIFMEVGSILFSGISVDIAKSIVFIGKILLCIILMIWVKNHFLLLNVERFLKITSIILLVETVIALLYKTDLLWRIQDDSNILNADRLQLLFIEPSELSMTAAVLLILLVYLCEKDGFKLVYIPMMIIFLLDMLLSGGMGGLLSLILSGFCVAVVLSIEKITKEGKYIYAIGVLLMVIISLLVLCFSNIAIAIRTRAICQSLFGGEMFADMSTASRLILPVMGIMPILKATSFWGMGLGNMNTYLGLEFLVQTASFRFCFPNSILYFWAEGGIMAIGGSVAGIVYLGRKTIASQQKFILLLFLFIIIYQIPGGYFTNPLNWVCYGILLSSGTEKSIAFLKRKN